MVTMKHIFYSLCADALYCTIDAVDVKCAQSNKVILEETDDDYDDYLRMDRWIKMDGRG